MSREHGQDPPPPPPLHEQSFRTLAAPGLDEDDLFAAMHGLPGRGALWGDADHPPARAFPPAQDQTRWDPAGERRRRHVEMLRKWRVAEDSPPEAGDHEDPGTTRPP